MITFEKCGCGYPTCKDYWLVGIGKFVQGSGFTEVEAKLITNLLNENMPTPDPTISRRAGQAIEQANPFGYRSEDSEP